MSVPVTGLAAEPIVVTGPVSRARASLAALETATRLAAARQPATEQDRALLDGWSGWGPLDKAFDPARSGSWQEIGDELRLLLCDGDYNEGLAAITTAFYTPAEVAAQCWRALSDLGFAGGHVLEPGCGSGVFMAYTPPDLAGSVDWIGVERDPSTARIAALLHPHAQVVASALEDAAIPGASVDAALGNVPFADTSVFDPAAPRAVTVNLHNYCIWRSIQTLRPGGIAILITSRYTMDSRSDAARRAFAADADLIGAIRLPNQAWTASGVEPVADILLLRRRHADEDARDQQWLVSQQVPELGGEPVNLWFQEHPGFVLGRLNRDRAAQFGRVLRVDRDAELRSMEHDLARAVDELVQRATPAGLTWDAAVSSAGGMPAWVPAPPDGCKECGFYVVDGLVQQVLEGKLTPVDRAGKELRDLIRLRDAVLAVLDAETDLDASEEDLDPLRRDLNLTYESYVAAHGYLHRYTEMPVKVLDKVTRSYAEKINELTGEPEVRQERPRMGGFRIDPDFATVLALEEWNDTALTGTKAAIFTQRVNCPRDLKEHADSPREAVLLCLDRHNSLDFDTIAALLGIEAKAVADALGDLAYRDPQTREWQTAEDYLCGDVRTKLGHARAAAESEGEDKWSRNVAALEAVQPADLRPEEIQVKLGTSWIPAHDVEQFVGELLGGRVRIVHDRTNESWEIQVRAGDPTGVAATAEWGTDRRHAYRLIELALNGRVPVVKDPTELPDGRIVDVRNATETLAAIDKQMALQARFAEWIWEEPKRADRLSSFYNRTFNSVVVRKYDGNHLTFPGLSSDFHPRPHQLDMVYRSISNPATLCGHAVGAGKTATMFLTAAKLRELGLVTKPLIVVPNHLLDQTAAEGKRLFPLARILVASQEDLAKPGGKKLFAARCATGTWDAVVMAHSTFTSLPVGADVEADFLERRSEDQRQAQLSARASGASDKTLKQISKRIERTRTKTRELRRAARQDGVRFEQLGCDYLFVDEAHYFKNLNVECASDGFSIAPSKQATDLELKMRWLARRSDRVATFYTGTPVANSLLELFIMLHYLNPQRLASAGVARADAWVRNFVVFETRVEIGPEGTPGLKTRPTKFGNFPELISMFAEIADVRTEADLDVERPRLVTANIVLEPSDDMAAAFDWIIGRAELVRSKMVEPYEDNLLWICSDGTKLALDPAMVGKPELGQPKIDAVVAKTAEIYHQNKDLELPGDVDTGVRGRLQIIFCDLGTPNKDKGTQVYGKIRTGLIESGVPATGIRFVQDAKKNDQKKALFAACRAGEVAVLLGSTNGLGVGTNVQDRCVAWHQLDFPWRPADIKQRRGRGHRPGNRNDEVFEYRYILRRSFDAYRLQTLERKAAFIDQLLSGRVTAREIEELGDDTMDCAEMKAASTGDPRFTELTELDHDIRRLRQLASAHSRTQRRLTEEIGNSHELIREREHLVGLLNEMSERIASSGDDVWRLRDHAVDPDDLPRTLGTLATAAVVDSRTATGLTWRDLEIGFRATRLSSGTALDAVIRLAWNREYAVQLELLWTRKGQQYRIRDEIVNRVTDAASDAAHFKDLISSSRQHIADAERQLGTPFPHAADLATAQARRDALDAELNADALENDQPDRTEPPTAADAADSTMSGELHQEQRPAKVTAGEREPSAALEVPADRPRATTVDLDDHAVAPLTLPRVSPQDPAGKTAPVDGEAAAVELPQGGPHTTPAAAAVLPVSQGDSDLTQNDDAADRNSDEETTPPTMSDRLTPLMITYTRTQGVLLLGTEKHDGWSKLNRDFTLKWLWSGRIETAAGEFGAWYLRSTRNKVLSGATRQRIERTARLLRAHDRAVSVVIEGDTDRSEPPLGVVDSEIPDRPLREQAAGTELGRGREPALPPQLNGDAIEVNDDAEDEQTAATPSRPNAGPAGEDNIAEQVETVAAVQRPSSRRLDHARPITPHQPQERGEQLDLWNPVGALHEVGAAKAPELDGAQDARDRRGQKVAAAKAETLAPVGESPPTLDEADSNRAGADLRQPGGPQQPQRQVAGRAHKASATTTGDHSADDLTILEVPTMSTPDSSRTDDRVLATAKAKEPTVEQKLVEALRELEHAREQANAAVKRAEVAERERDDARGKADVADEQITEARAAATAATARAGDHLTARRAAEAKGADLEERYVALGRRFEEVEQELAAMRVEVVQLQTALTDGQTRVAGTVAPASPGADTTSVGEGPARATAAPESQRQAPPVTVAGPEPNPDVADRASTLLMEHAVALGYAVRVVPTVDDAARLVTLPAAPTARAGREALAAVVAELHARTVPRDWAQLVAQAELLGYTVHGPGMPRPAGPTINSTDGSVTVHSTTFDAASAELASAVTRLQQQPTLAPPVRTPAPQTARVSLFGPQGQALFAPAPPPAARATTALAGERPLSRRQMLAKALSPRRTHGWQR
ncbi:hypothetical protein F0L68_17255 [Solihabitans fulvus]|uniref:Helicase C-terminal domain-containing protein n=1 Tax=Solihabitans fulvus TaxID=1892852 RepID=A0A5B2XF31_9PSEU|nr:helicase-related protein [Solihabitans fulvus]KAA2261520.1 hypothetical protein F0L68_17255 [Solihabitans fulvus]